MKGFIYLLEIAVASILITIVLGTFFAIRIKENWERSDIIATGNNILNYLKQNKSFFVNILNENLTDIEKVKPANVRYGLEVVGSPKSNIKVGCIDYCDYLGNLLTPAYVNGRWINFSIEEFDIDETGSIPYYLDAVVFVNYTDYSSQKQKIKDYLNGGGMVLGINATESSTDQDFNGIFDLGGASGSSQYVNFSFYDPLKDNIEKYFLGFGFDGYSSWWIWEDEWSISYTASYVNITKVSNPSVNKTFLTEGNVFYLTGPDSKNYYFKVKKIWYPTRVDFQVLNTSFVFKDFSEKNIKGNKINILNYTAIGNTFAAMTTNNSAIWISDFPQSDEYRTLVKAAIASRTDKWFAKKIVTSKDILTVSQFTALCCDMPEMSELILSLSYIV